MPLNKKGKKIMKSMKKQYGKKKGEKIFYASKNKVKVAEQQVEVDPRSKTTADQAFNYIGTGGPEEEVQGQGAVLAEKKRKSKAY